MICVANDRHKTRAMQIRLHPLLRAQLEKLATQNASTLTSEVSIAIRKHLTEAGLWPPPPERKQR